MTADLSLAGRWIAARIRLTMRNPRAVIFTFLMPLFLLVLVSALSGGDKVAALAGSSTEVPFAQFYAPSMGVFGLVVACYTTLVVGVATARDNGLLKRVRGTPLPMQIYLGSWAVGAGLIGFAAVVLMVAVAVPAFGVDVYASKVPIAIVVLFLGAFALTGCGLMVASLVRNADQAMPVAQLTFLPLSFISGLFFPIGGASQWVIDVAKVFPLFHLHQAFAACFVPGAHVALGDLAVLALWGVVTLRIAARRFSSESEPRAWLRLPGRARTSGA